MEKRRKPDDLHASKLAQALMELGSKIGNWLGRSGERATEVQRANALIAALLRLPPVHAPTSRTFFLSRKGESGWPGRTTFSANRDFS
jgi:hypothetical protein